MRWHIKAGKYWLFQWGWPVGFSLGIHVDYRLSYIDLHLGWVLLTLGNMQVEYKEYQAWWSSRWQQ